MNLVKDRTKDIARIKSILDRSGINATGNCTTYKYIDSIEYGHLALEYQKVIAGYIEKIKDFTRLIYDMNLFIKKTVKDDEDIINLITIPGVSYFSAALIKSEIININRFASFKKLCAYAGLSPRVSQSANKMFHGRLNNNRRKYLQWIILEIVWNFIQKVPEKKERYEEISKRKSANTAKVNMARDMLKIIYRILKDKRPFYMNIDEKKPVCGGTCAQRGLKTGIFTPGLPCV
jgi:transposase